jgi:thiol-disulfide isomerase/thioredoxin
MRSTRSLLAPHAAAIVVALLVPSLAPAGETPAPGDAFPSLESFQLEGTVPDVAAARVVIVDFWASWCAPCKASFPVFDELHEKFGPKGLVIVAVSVDTRKAGMDAFVARQKPTFPIVRDAAMKLVAAVDPPAMPTSFVLDSKGTVRFVHIGFHGGKSRDEYVEQIESILSETTP